MDVFFFYILCIVRHKLLTLSLFGWIQPDGFPGQPFGLFQVALDPEGVLGQKETPLSLLAVRLHLSHHTTRSFPVKGQQIFDTSAVSYFFPNLD